jgi:hypothetical protein
METKNNNNKQITSTLKFGYIIKKFYNFLTLVFTSEVDGGFAYIILQIIKRLWNKKKHESQRKHNGKVDKEGKKHAREDRHTDHK